MRRAPQISGVALKARASFVFVSHRLDEVLQLADRVYVMKDGAVVSELPTPDADVTTLHRLMVGRSLQADYYREPLQRPARPDVLLEVEGLSHGKAYRDVSFKLHAGEILGIAGVIGSGREELARTLHATARGLKQSCASREEFVKGMTVAARMFCAPLNQRG